MLNIKRVTSTVYFLYFCFVNDTCSSEDNYCLTEGSVDRERQVIKAEVGFSQVLSKVFRHTLITVFILLVRKVCLFKVASCLVSISSSH